jgi:hypothetical protein
MDYPPFQATSVPCERVFSSAKETGTAKRNRMSPVLMEALQLLKFALKQCLDFDLLGALFRGDSGAVVDDL